MRYNDDEIENLSYNFDQDGRLGYPIELFSNLLEYTCPELLKLKYTKRRGFAYFGESEFLSITEDFFAKVKLRENLYVSEFGVYRRAIGFVYKDEIYVITPDEDDLTTIYIINKETKARRVYRDIHKSKVLDFIEGKYIHEKSDKDFGFIGSLIEFRLLNNMGYPNIEDFFVFDVKDVENDDNTGDKSIYTHIAHDKEKGIVTFYNENWGYGTLGSLEEWGNDYYEDDEWE